MLISMGQRSPFKMRNEELDAWGHLVIQFIILLYLIANMFFKIFLFVLSYEIIIKWLVLDFSVLLFCLLAWYMGFNSFIPLLCFIVLFHCLVYFYKQYRAVFIFIIFRQTSNLIFYVNAFAFTLLLYYMYFCYLILYFDLLYPFSLLLFIFFILYF